MPSHPDLVKLRRKQKKLITSRAPLAEIVAVNTEILIRFTMPRTFRRAMKPDPKRRRSSEG